MKASAKLGVTFLGLFVVLAACSTTDDADLPADQKVTALRGTIKDTGGQPLSGVTVRAGSVSATSDAQGRFDLRAPSGSTVARFAKDGFVDGIRAVSLVNGRPTQLDIKMLPFAAPLPLDATAGGTVTGSRSAGLMAPPGAFVDGAGNPVTGMVNVHLTPLDPSVSGELAAAPPFVAEASGAPAMLESFGMIDVTVKQGDKKLSVTAGQELELRIPPPAGATSPEPSMPLWSFDEAKGIWVEEGVATYDAASKTYIGKAKHMSMWNADKPYLATCVCGLVKEKGGAVLPGARIDAEGVSYFGSSSTNAELDGKFCLPVRKDSDVSVAAYHRSGGGQVRRIMSGGSDTMVPVDPADPRCVDIGVWEVERDVFVSADGTKVSCGEAGNPFASGCARNFGEIFGTCFKPQGACVTRIEGSGTTTRYANGAYTAVNGTTSTYYSASGQLCATSTFDLGDGTSPLSSVYTLPNGETFTMIIGDGSDLVVKCSDGTETRLTPEQRQALEACGGGGTGSDETSEGCTQEFGAMDGGAVGTTCLDNSMCGGNVCCVIPDQTDKICLPSATCDAIPR